MTEAIKARAEKHNQKLNVMIRSLTLKLQNPDVANMGQTVTAPIQRHVDLLIRLEKETRKNMDAPSADYNITDKEIGGHASATKKFETFLTTLLNRLNHLLQH